MMDELQPVDGMGPVSEVRIKPDPDTFVTLPYAPGAAAMLSGQVNPDFPAEPTPIGESLCYSATGFHLAHDYIIDLVAALNKQGLEVEHYHPGLGHGQQEVPMRRRAYLGAAAPLAYS
jgi:glutamine synthetase